MIFGSSDADTVCRDTTNIHCLPKLVRLFECDTEYDSAVAKLSMRLLWRAQQELLYRKHDFQSLIRSKRIYRLLAWTLFALVTMDSQQTLDAALVQPTAVRSSINEVLMTFHDLILDQHTSWTL